MKIAMIFIAFGLLAGVIQRIINTLVGLDGPRYAPADDQKRNHRDQNNLYESPHKGFAPNHGCVRVYVAGVVYDDQLTHDPVLLVEGQRINVYRTTSQVDKLALFCVLCEGEFGFRINKFTDQPGGGHSIHTGSRPPGTCPPSLSR